MFNNTEILKKGRPATNLLKKKTFAVENKNWFCTSISSRALRNLFRNVLKKCGGNVDCCGQSFCSCGKKSWTCKVNLHRYGPR